MQATNTLGRHILAEFYDCNVALLNETDTLETLMTHAAKAAGATVVQSVFHHFSPYGVSGVVVIAESHLTIHTWPELGYAALDLFTCGDSVDPMRAWDYLEAALEAGRTDIQELRRGHLNRIRPEEAPFHSALWLAQKGGVG